MEKRIKRTRVYSGRIISMYKDKVRINGRLTTRELIIHPGSAIIIPVLDPSRMEILLIRQYRYAAGQYLFELPAGTRDPEESPLRTARREIIEETGYSARYLKQISRFFLAPGTMNEQMSVFIATGLSKKKQDTEFDEDITVLKTTLEKAVRMVFSGRIKDAKTIAGLMMLKHVVSDKKLKQRFLKAN